MQKKILKYPILVALILLLALAGSGCLSGWLWPTQVTPDISYPVYQSRTEPTSGEIKTTPSPSPTPAASITPAPSASFHDQVFQLLLAGLAKRQKVINLDAAVRSRQIPEIDAQDTIDKTFKVFTEIYLTRPEFYYLNGSMTVNYSVLKGGNPVLSALSVKPIYWERTKDLSDSELNQLIGQIDQKVSEIAGQIRTKSPEPWIQLKLLHDYLVTNIAYDASGNAENNQVFSALLDGLTLCQGYARSFQLIGIKLGFDVRLISGETNGAGHAWNLVKLDGQYYHVDVTFDDPTPDAGSRAPVQHVHFLRSDSQMLETHIWDAKAYPLCPIDGANYYRENNLTAGSLKTLDSKIKTFCSGLDYTKKKKILHELLYTGSQPPGVAKLAAIVKEALQAAPGGTTVKYRYQIIKSVVLVEITTGA